MITEWGQLESRAGLLSQSCRVRAGLVFKSRGRPYLHVLLLYSKLLVEDSEWLESRTDMTIFIEILTMPALKKEGIFSGETVGWNGKGQRPWEVNMIKALCRHV
jgi:hypothetical protein